MTNNHSKGRAIALLPIAVFLLFFIGSGLITGDFYSMPAIVGFLIALIIAFLQNQKLSFVQKLRLASTGVGDENILTMCLIFLAAGAFSSARSFYSRDTVTAAVFKNSGFVGCFAICVKIYGNSLLHIVYLI